MSCRRLRSLLRTHQCVCKEKRSKSAPNVVPVCFKLKLPGYTVRKNSSISLSGSEDRLEELFTNDEDNSHRSSVLYEPDFSSASHSVAQIQTDIALGSLLQSTLIGSLSDEGSTCNSKLEMPWRDLLIPPKGTKLQRIATMPAIEPEPGPTSGTASEPAFASIPEPAPESSPEAAPESSPEAAPEPKSEPQSVSVCRFNQPLCDVDVELFYEPYCETLLEQSDKEKNYTFPIPWDEILVQPLKQFHKTTQIPEIGTPETDLDFSFLQKETHDATCPCKACKYRTEKEAKEQKSAAPLQLPQQGTSRSALVPTGGSIFTGVPATVMMPPSAGLYCTCAAPGLQGQGAGQTGFNSDVFNTSSRVFPPKGRPSKIVTKVIIRGLPTSEIVPNTSSHRSIKARLQYKVSNPDMMHETGSHRKVLTKIRIVPSNEDNDSEDTSILSIQDPLIHKDHVTTALASYENEIRPLREALSALQAKIRSLHIPELNTPDSGVSSRRCDRDSTKYKDESPTMERSKKKMKNHRSSGKRRSARYTDDTELSYGANNSRSPIAEMYVNLANKITSSASIMFSNRTNVSPEMPQSKSFDLNKPATASAAPPSSFIPGSTALRTDPNDFLRIRKNQSKYR